MFCPVRLPVSTAVLGCLVLLGMSCSRSKGGIDGTDESKDHIPPSAISDLTVTNTSTTSITLRWTAPGDDGDSGQAALYDLRYSEAAITDQDWDSATIVPGVAEPSPTRTADSAVVSDLEEDSTYYFALRTADELGNWSHLSNVVSASCFENVVVPIGDTALERIIRFYVNRPTGDITRLDMLTVWAINAWSQHLHDLSGLEYCTNLVALRLSNNSVTDLTPLSNLQNLRTLDMGYNGLSEIGPLASLALLDTLKLNSNNLSDLTPLSGMTQLKNLELAYNAIENLTPLDGKTAIRELSLEGNQIVFVNALYGLTGLEKLRLGNNLINDLLPLAYNSGLGMGDTIWLEGNPLSAATTDSLIGVLQNRGVTVLR